MDHSGYNRQVLESRSLSEEINQGWRVDHHYFYYWPENSSQRYSWMWKSRWGLWLSYQLENALTLLRQDFQNYNPEKFHGHVLFIFRWFVWSCIIKWGNKTPKTSWHSILQQTKDAMTLWVAGIFFGGSCTDGYSLNSRSWIIDQAEGWRTVLAASLTFLTPEELGCVNKKWHQTKKGYGFVAGLIQRQRGQF